MRRSELAEATEYSWWQLLTLATHSVRCGSNLLITVTLIPHSVDILTAEQPLLTYVTA